MFVYFILLIGNPLVTLYDFNNAKMKDILFHLAEAEVNSTEIKIISLLWR